MALNIYISVNMKYKILMHFHIIVNVVQNISKRSWMLFMTCITKTLHDNYYACLPAK